MPLATQPSVQNHDFCQLAWMHRHRAKQRDALQSGDRCRIVFLGDSITQGWEEEGREVWDSAFSAFYPFNLGFNGDKTENLLWRVQNGALAGLSPELVVLLIGTNNTGHRFDSAEDTHAGICLILQEVWRQIPPAKVLLQAILPRGTSVNDKLQRRNQQVNALLSALCYDNQLVYRDYAGLLLETPTGLVDKRLMPDALHPNAAGYARLADAMQGDISALLTR